MAKTGSTPPAPVWEGIAYHRVPPGRYTAAVTRIQGPEWVYAWHRWSLLVEFELLGDAEQVKVCAFFNMGNDPKRPNVGRRSRYFRAWTKANGELPRNGQAMTPDVFCEGQVYEIRVDDSRKDSDDRPKQDCEVYSVATEILSVQRPNRSIMNPSIMNQESRITESHNQAINQSRRPHIRHRARRSGFA